MDDDRDFAEVRMTPIVAMEPTEDEFHAWGLIKWKTLTRKEVEERFPAEYRRYKP